MAVDEGTTNLESNAIETLPPTDENSMDLSKQQLSVQKYIPPHRVNPYNANVSDLGLTFLCYLCKDMHKRGN